MKPVLVVNPNTSPEMSEAIKVGVFNSNSPAAVEVANVDWGPTSIESELDSLVASTAVVEMLWQNRNDYSGFVIACFDDPGVAEARELVGKPVIGIGEAAITRARDGFESIGVLVVANRVKKRVSQHFRAHNVEPSRLNLLGLESSVVDLNSPDSKLTDKFITAGRVLKDQGAQCIVLACAGFSHQRQLLEDSLGIPILDGNKLAVQNILERAASSELNDDFEAPQPFTGSRPSLPVWAGVTAETLSQERKVR